MTQLVMFNENEGRITLLQAYSLDPATASRYAYQVRHSRHCGGFVSISSRLSQYLSEWVAVCPVPSPFNFSMRQATAEPRLCNARMELCAEENRCTQ